MNEIKINLEEAKGHSVNFNGENFLLFFRKRI